MTETRKILIVKQGTSVAPSAVWDSCGYWPDTEAPTVFTQSLLAGTQRITDGPLGTAHVYLGVAKWTPEHEADRAAWLASGDLVAVIEHQAGQPAVTTRMP